MMNACGSKAAAWAVDLLGFGSALWDARRHGCWTIWEMAPGGVAERADEDLLPGDRILDANGRQMCSQVVREEIVHSDLLGLELGVVRNEQVRQTRGRRQRLRAPSTPIDTPRTIQGVRESGTPGSTPSVSSED